jgi:hypothetical protein
MLSNLAEFPFIAGTKVEFSNRHNADGQIGNANRFDKRFNVSVVLVKLNQDVCIARS